MKSTAITLGICTTLLSLPAYGAALKPTQIVVAVPSGTNNALAAGSYTYNADNTTTPTQLTGVGAAAGQTYVDDVLLSSITFGGVTLDSSNMREAQNAYVSVNRANINAEYGDSDTGSDGNPNPFVSAGIISEGASLPATTRESTNSAIQDKAIQQAFNSLSISQGVDGEEPSQSGTNPTAPNYTYNLTFDNGIVDNDNTADTTPELLFFERGNNSSFTISAITGGTLTSPTTTGSVTVAKGSMLPSGIYIDTIEINSGQQLGVIGFDLNDFGISSGQTVYGVQLTSTDNTGADIYGQFLTASSPTQFKRQVVPEPTTIVGSMLGLGFGLVLLRVQAKRQTSATKV